MRALDEHEAAEAAARKAAICNCYESLLLRDIKQACSAHYQYTKQFTLNRSTNSQYELLGKFVEIVFDTRPSALGYLDEIQWTTSQALAAATKLWRYGTRERFPLPLQPDEALSGINYQRVIDFILNAAENRENLQRMWTDSVKISFEDYDLDLCDHCRSLDGKTYKKSDVPEIPTPACTSEIGCRCSFDPVDDETIDLSDEFDTDDFILPPIEAMKQLKEMANAGLITEDEFQNKKKEILDRM
jgi:hypothetical protein